MKQRMPKVEFSKEFRGITVSIVSPAVLIARPFGNSECNFGLSVQKSLGLLQGL